MRNLLIALFFVVFLVGAVQAQPILVPSYGETGWQTYSHTHTEVDPWTGMLVLGVVDTYDMEAESYLLIDNLINMGPAGNQGFEQGDLTGFVFGSSVSVGASAVSYGGTTYTPAEGNFMAILDSVDGNSGTDASGLTTYTGIPTTDGSYISFPLTLTQDLTVSFDWNFFTTDSVPFEDYAFLGVEGGETPHVEVLAKIAAIPEPSSLLLLSLGLLGLFKRRFKSR